MVFLFWFIEAVKMDGGRGDGKTVTVGAGATIVYHI
jgi:hypothetical protein